MIDDGSTDETIAVARAHGVDHIVRLTNNKGLAAGFQAGLDACLKLGADVIVNTDADNQYYGPDISRLVAPILAGRADMVVGDREVTGIEHFSPLKKTLQRLGSWVVRQASSTTVPDTTSGFRAYNREAAIQLLVVSKFTYTLETIIQAGKQLVAIDHVPVRTNPKTRESRLFPSMGAYVRRNAVSIFRIYAQYEPLRVFWSLSALMGVVALAVWIRFVVAYADGSGKGHVQSLILGAVLFIAAVVLWALGVIGDLLAAQRVMTQKTFERVRRIELELKVAPSHYEPGLPPERRNGQDEPRPGRDGRPASEARRGNRGARGGEVVSGAVTVSDEGIVTGNTYDKYGSTNPVVRRLMSAFERTLDELFAQADPSSLLDVGCGEGVLVHKWAQRLGEQRRVVGIDLEEESIQAGWAERAGAEPRVPGDARREPAVRRERVRPRERDRGARARPRPRAHARRDGALRRAPPARLGSPRAALAGAEHGARRLLVGAREHPRAPQPLVAARVRRPALALRRRHRGPLAVPLDDAACPALGPVSRTPSPGVPPPAGKDQAGGRGLDGRRSAAAAHRAPTAAARGSCRSGSPRRGC